MDISSRQEQICHHLIQGLSQKEIANHLFISEHTVKFHCRNLYRSVGVKNRIELLLFLFGENEWKSKLKKAKGNNPNPTKKLENENIGENTSN